MLRILYTRRSSSQGCWKGNRSFEEPLVSAPMYLLIRPPTNAGGIVIDKDQKLLLRNGLEPES